MDREVLKGKILNLTKNIGRLAERARSKAVTSRELDRQEERRKLDRRTERSFRRGNKSEFLSNVARRPRLERKQAREIINVPYNALTKSKGKFRRSYQVGNVGYKPPRLI